ncbi:MAG: hypothetical protein RIR18_1615 [Pseudomonadota bacterium]|jgi:hypothetical protein
MTYSLRHILWFLLFTLNFGVLSGLSGCASQPDEHGMASTSFSPKHFAKGDLDRVADTMRQETMVGLLKLADKLYKRNPKEWRKLSSVGVTTVDDAVRRLKDHSLPSSELNGLKEGQVIAKAFSSDYQGDRVGAFILGMLQMTDAAFDYKDEFFMLDSLDVQKLYNLARNYEIAAWKLSNQMQANGEPWLYSNEASGPIRNLSFEREFGRLIGLLDFHVKLLTDKSGRSVTRFSQSLATAIFLPIAGF